LRCARQQSWSTLHHEPIDLANPPTRINHECRGGCADGPSCQEAARLWDLPTFIGLETALPMQHRNTRQRRTSVVTWLQVIVSRNPSATLLRSWVLEKPSPQSYSWLHQSISSAVDGPMRFRMNARRYTTYVRRHDLCVWS